MTFIAYNDLMTFVEKYTQEVILWKVKQLQHMKTRPSAINPTGEVLM